MLWLVAGATPCSWPMTCRARRRVPGRLLPSHGIDVLETTPSYAAQLLHGGLPTRRRRGPLLLALGGEAVPPELLDRAGRRPRRRRPQLLRPDRIHRGLRDRARDRRRHADHRPRRSPTPCPRPRPDLRAGPRRGARASCTSPVPAWRAATWAARPRPPRASSPTRSARRAPGCTAPATSSAGAGRRARVPRPHRRPGQAPRLPHRTRRNRVRASLHARGSNGPSPSPTAILPSAWSPTTPAAARTPMSCAPWRRRSSPTIWSRPSSCSFRHPLTPARQT